MKKIILTTLAVVSFGFANAQSREKGTIELTPKIGYLGANYYGNQVVTDNSKISSVSFGLEGDYFFNNRWSLHSGLLYQTMGTKLSTYKEKLDYLMIPVDASWHFGSTRKWNLNFGPCVGFLLAADADGVNVKDLANETQVGLSIGIGYKIEVTDKFSILLDYQGFAGFTEVSKKQDATFSNAYDSFNIGAVLKL